jgi:hypothetical protein
VRSTVNFCNRSPPVDKEKIEDHWNKLLRYAMDTLCDQLEKHFPDQLLNVECSRAKKRGESSEFTLVCDPLHRNERTLVSVQVIVPLKRTGILLCVFDEILIHEESGDYVVDILIELEQQLALPSFVWRPGINPKS